MNQIDTPQLDTPVTIEGGKLIFRKSPSWAIWLQQVYQALFRPTITTTLSFGVTASGASTDVAVAFPAGTVALTDIPCMRAPQSVSGTCFTCYIKAVDEVMVRFNNFSGGPLAFAANTFAVSVLNQ